WEQERSMKSRNDTEAGLGARRSGASRAARKSAWGGGPRGIKGCCQSRWRFVAIALLALAVSGCRQDMHNQPKYRALRASTFFADGSSARPIVEGTIARGA